MKQTIADVREGIKANRFNTKNMLDKYKINIKSVTDIEMKITHFDNQLRIMEAQEYILEILEKTQIAFISGKDVSNE